MKTDSNNKDIRFSKLLSTVEKGKVLPDRQFLDQLRDKAIEEFEIYSVESEDQLEAATTSIWRISMKSSITKIAAAAVLIIAVLIGINQFGGSVDVSSVAFGQVLEYFQGSSYSFDLTFATVIEDEDRISEAYTSRAKVWEMGKMRFDCSENGKIGSISSIADFNTGRSLLLFHHNKTAVTKKESVLSNAGVKGIFSFCSKPVENLWNLRDGTEEQLGEKEIDGQRVTGFRVFQKDKYFEYDITIWADFESGAPRLVEVMANPLEDYLSVKWTMENFDLDVELDEGLFSLEVPAGYILAYQEDLEKLEVDTEPSVESGKIVQMLELWSQGKKDEAVELLVGVDWTKQIEFGREPYIFSLTEKGYVSLKPKDQQRAIKNIMAMASTMKKIAKEALAKGKAATSNRNYDHAEQYFNAGLQLGKLLDRNPESMIITRLVGISVESITLKEMISLYKTTNDHEKLQAAENQLRMAEAERDEIKKKAMGL
ncbi:MAG: hypothetical protein FVQ79_07125 [Planctomycetes bacterium]|nr:hypothetical protein [Planctomycetota bacterium]